MKVFNLFLVLTALATFSSCSNDDNDPKNLATETTGQYTGYTVASCNYFSNMVTDNQIIKITSSELNKVNISYVSDTWGTFTINDAEVSGTDGNLIISGTGKTAMAHAGNAASEYDCTVAGTLINKTLSLTFTCPQVMGGLKIEFNQGDIPSDIVVPGTYSGYTEASSAYFSGMTADDQKIVIAKNNDGSFKLTYSSDTWGDFTIDSVSAQYSNGAFTISGDGVTKMGMEGNVKEYDCSVSGTIDVEKEDPTFTFSVPTVMGGLTIIFHTGEMPSE